MATQRRWWPSPRRLLTVPADYQTFFQATVGAAGTLIGLLFVAVALRPETIYGDRASQRGQALAGSAFTSLVNAFFVSLVALLPGNNLGYVAALMAAFGMAASLRLRRTPGGNGLNNGFSLVTMGMYLAELATAGVLLANPALHHAIDTLVAILVVSLAVALGRAWMLLQGRHLPPEPVPQEQQAVQPGP